VLNAVIRFALHYRLLIVFLALAALVYGSYTAAMLPIDVFPDLDRPRVVVMTECPGYTPADVDTLVTYPLESALLGATGVQAVRAQSAPGLSMIYVEFDWGTDIRHARVVVQERLAMAEGLPEGVRPQMAPISSIMGQIMHVGLYRQPGPRGGVLTTVGKTPYLAEWVPAGSPDEDAVYLWNPRNTTFCKGIVSAYGSRTTIAEPLVAPSFRRSQAPARRPVTKKSCLTNTYVTFAKC
jgi:HME family heavy-metal exporter